jgi:hypothetical protein
MSCRILVERLRRIKSRGMCRMQQHMSNCNALADLLSFYYLNYFIPDSADAKDEPRVLQVLCGSA